MGRPARHRLALDLDQAVALHVLRTVFGAAQVTVTNFQPIEPADRDPARHPNASMAGHAV